MRIVLDTNNLISSLIQSRGPSALLIDAWLDDGFELVSAWEQLDELKDVLSRERIRKRVSEAERTELCNLLAREAILEKPVEGVQLSSDPKDNFIIGIAIAGRADLIVTGDKHDLLSLGQAAGIPIVTARQALERLAQQSGA